VTGTVLTQVVDCLRDRGAATAEVNRLTVGDAAVLVELAGVGDGDGDAAGLAHRPRGTAPATDGVDVPRLLSWATDGDDWSEDGRVRRALGLATLNALTVPHVEWRTGDPMAVVDPGVARITTVGLFRPALRKFDDVDVRVIERDPVEAVSAPTNVRVETFTPDATAAAMAGAEVVFLTGSAFVYGGAEAYLDAAPSTATVVVVGATASFHPAPLFAAGVDVVAGAVVDDVTRVREAVAAGACGTDLHDAGARKVYVRADRPTELRIRETDDDRE